MGSRWEHGGKTPHYAPKVAVACGAGALCSSPHSRILGDCQTPGALQSPGGAGGAGARPLPPITIVIN